MKLNTIFQIYTIFNKKNWILISPILLILFVRFFFLLTNENNYYHVSILESLLFPFVFDTVFYILGLLIVPNRLTKIYIIIVSIFLFFSNLIFFHHFKIYYLPPGTGAIAALFETTPLEAIEFTKLTPLNDLIGTVLLSAIHLISLISILKIKFQPKELLIFSSPFILLIFIIQTLNFTRIVNTKLKPVDNSYLYNDFKNILHYGQEYYTLKTLRNNRTNIKFNAKQDSVVHIYPQTHVLIIGESLSRNHMSIYGYDVETTPHFDKMDSLLAYNNVISPTTQTRSSIVRMLTTSFGLNTDNFYKEGSIITAMKESGYETYWISNQARYGISDTETSVLADDAHQSIFVNTDWKAKSLDEKVIAPLIKILKNDITHKFIIIHLLGSHFEYIKRVPDYGYSFTNKKKGEYLTDFENSKINEYDATVKYTDFVIDSISKLINKYSPTSSWLFLSDHGEDVFDDDRKLLGHGSPYVSRFTVEIPFLVWRSSQFKKLGTIPKQNNFYSNFYNSGNLFHSLCDLYEIQLGEFEESRSIFSSLNNQSKYPYIINSNNEKINYFEIK